MEKLDQKEKKFVATYSRVSTSAQEVQETIENQTMALKEYAGENNLEVVQEYKDEGWSGDILARPKLDQLRQDAKKDIWDAVLIYDPDRLARRYSYQELVMDELKEAGIEVIFVTISTPKNSEEKILYGVRGLFAEYERAKIAERFRLGKVSRVKNGHILLTEGPFGYNYILNKGKKGNPDYVPGHLEVNKREAKIVKDIFTWVADEGLTVRGIVRRLRELGIQPRKSKRGVWNTSTLCTLLRKETYIGTAYWNVSYVGSPMPSVILSLKDGKYRADPFFMKEPKPTDAEIQKFANEVISWSGDGSNGYPPVVAWKYALNLIYSGNIDSAKKYVDLAWKNNSPGEFKTKEGFWNELNEQIGESLYYTDLEDYFNL